MDPINPWLDPVEVRQLAERLMRPNRETPMDAADTGFDDGFVGFASAPQTPAAQSPAPAASTSTPVAASATGPFLDKILRFRDWMHRDFQASGVFILDHEGTVLFDESHHGRLHFLARSLALSSRKQGDAAGNVHVKIGAGSGLEVIPVETAAGWLVLGAVVPAPLPPAAVAAVMDALCRIAA